MTGNPLQKDPMSLSGLAHDGYNDAFEFPNVLKLPNASKAPVRAAIAGPRQAPGATAAKPLRTPQPVPGLPMVMPPSAKMANAPLIYTPGKNGPVVNDQTVPSVTPIKSSPQVPQVNQPSQHGTYPPTGVMQKLAAMSLTCDSYDEPFQIKSVVSTGQETWDELAEYSRKKPKKKRAKQASFEKQANMWGSLLGGAGKLVGALGRSGGARIGGGLMRGIGGATANVGDDIARAAAGSADDLAQGAAGIGAKTVGGSLKPPAPPQATLSSPTQVQTPLGTVAPPGTPLKANSAGGPGFVRDRWSVPAGKPTPAAPKPTTPTQPAAPAPQPSGGGGSQVPPGAAPANPIGQAHNRYAPPTNPTAVQPSGGGSQVAPPATHHSIPRGTPSGAAPAAPTMLGRAGGAVMGGLAGPGILGSADFVANQLGYDTNFLETYGPGAAVAGGLVGLANPGSLSKLNPSNLWKGKTLGDKALGGLGLADATVGAVMPADGIVRAAGSAPDPENPGQIKDGPGLWDYVKNPGKTIGDVAFNTFTKPQLDAEIKKIPLAQAFGINSYDDFVNSPLQKYADIYNKEGPGAAISAFWSEMTPAQQGMVMAGGGVAALGALLAVTGNVGAGAAAGIGGSVLGGAGLASALWNKPQDVMDNLVQSLSPEDKALFQSGALADPEGYQALRAAIQQNPSSANANAQAYLQQLRSQSAGSELQAAQGSPAPPPQPAVTPPPQGAPPPPLPAPT